MKTNANDRVSPFTELDSVGNPYYEHLGLSKREHFAGLAMQGNLALLGDKFLYSEARQHAKSLGMTVKEYVAAESVKMAELLIESLNK